MQETININVNGNIIDVLKQIKEGFESSSKSNEKFQQTAAGSFSKIESQLKSVNLASFHQNLQNVSQGLTELNAPGLSFNAQLQDLSALTGTTGAELDKLGEKARSSAKEFGGTAAASLNNYKTILGRLGPGIAKDREALNLMERDVQILSKTMGGDTVGAVDALTTSALQFGVDLSNPKEAAKEMTRMMDIMAASAREGSAEVPQISAAMKASGVAAKQAKVSFVEVNAAIQTLAAGGKEGSEAGVALRNILGKMGGEDIIPKEAAEKLVRLGVDMKIVSNTALPFTTRLRELKKAQGDATIMAQMFGVENAAAASILLDSVDAQDSLAKKIDKTGVAMEMAKAIMDTQEEKLKRMNAAIEDSKIAFFEATGGMTAYLGPVAQVATTINSLTPIYNVSKLAVLTLATAEGRAALMTNISNKAKAVSATASRAMAAANITAGNSAVGASSKLAMMGTALKGVGLLAFIALAADAGMKLWNMASGADAAARAVERMRNAQKDGIKEADRTTKIATQAESKASKKNERDFKSGKISEDDYNARKLEIAKNHYNYLKQEKESAAASVKIQEDWARDAKKKGDDEKYRSLLAARKGNLSRVHALSDDVQAAKDTYLDLIAEAEGKKSGTSKNTPLATVGGYTPPKESKENKVIGGAGDVKRIDVRIENLVKEINLTSNNIKESTAEIKRMVTEALVGAVRDFEVAI